MSLWKSGEKWQMPVTKPLERIIFVSFLVDDIEEFQDIWMHEATDLLQKHPEYAINQFGERLQGHFFIFLIETSDNLDAYTASEYVPSEMLGQKDMDVETSR